MDILKMNKKYITPKEVQSMYGIKTSTLARQRWGKYGLFDCCITLTKPGSKRGLILYSIEKIENKLDRLTNNGGTDDRRIQI
jgi:hypothetical protein|tara:strand:+ start:248 stop:493 length:246 start_codon:yes stop_codon:yes gene_type:complete